MGRSINNSLETFLTSLDNNNNISNNNNAIDVVDDSCNDPSLDLETVQVREGFKVNTTHYLEKCPYYTTTTNILGW